MIHAFGQFELDTGRMELRANGAPVAIEPQVFALLRLLVENSDRMVSKDEIIAQVWNGRIVSDAAIASRVKSARQALGDDGKSQGMIRTVRGLGFAFVAKERGPEPAATGVSSIMAETAPAARPRLCVLPFRLVGIADANFPVADALPYDLITELSRLHWLFVIARGSSFQFRGAAARLANVRAQLDVQYCLTGVVEVVGRRMTVSVELSDTRSESVVWGERFSAAIDDVHTVRDEIVSAIVGAVEIRIPLNEAQAARRVATEQLDAWGAYHLGLHHMYRFNEADNAAATALFEQSIARDPDFSRAHAGLSFTHFQNAFLRYAKEGGARERAQRHAERALELDPLDPFGQLVMGRAQWLSGDLEGSLGWLDRANALNPNYAQARYTRGLTAALLSASGDARAHVDAALALSPLDPLVYGMHGVKALSYIIDGDHDAAAECAERAVNSPGSHALIAIIAVASHALAGNDVRALYWADSAKARARSLTREDFLRSFPFREARVRAQFTDVLGRFGY
jgi:TolB-like protein